MIDPLMSLRDRQISLVSPSHRRFQPFTVVYTLIEKGQLSCALHQLRTMRVSSEHRQEYHCLMGKCYEALGHFPQAFQQFQIALQIDPDCKDAREAIKHLPHAYAYEDTPSSQRGITDKLLRWLNSDIRF